MGVFCSFFSPAVHVPDVPRRNRGRFFNALTAALLFGSSARAAESWDLILEVDGAGRVSVVSQIPREGRGPLPPAQPLREGLTCLELRDEDGRLLDRRALPLAPEVFYDREAEPGRLEGGTAAPERMQYQVRVPRLPGRRHALSFFRIRRRTARASVPRAAAPPLSRPDDFDLEPQGAVSLEAAP